MSIGLAPFLVLSGLIVMLPLAWAEATTPESLQLASPWWDRPALLDSPNSFKQTLRDHGVGLEGWWTQFYQGVTSGDGDKEWQLGGKGDLFLILDGTKLGQWQGFSATVHQEWITGEDVNMQGDGSLLPLNTALGFPRLGGRDEETSLVLTQQFNQSLTINLGKFNLLDSAAKTPLLGGGGLDTFFNTAIAAPISGVTPPYLLGTIASLKTEPAVFTLMVYDPRNAQDWDIIENPFTEGVTTSLSITLPTQFSGRSGYYGVRGVYSTKEGLNLKDAPGLLLPSEAETILIKEGYWYCSVNMQQYLVQDANNPNIGWGVFADLAVSDGNPNPFSWRFIGGLAGNSPLAGRNLDRWGVAYFRYGLSDDLLDGLDTLGMYFGDEQGMELFYNYAITPWLRLSGDVQWINPHQINKEDALVTAVRMQIRF